MSIIYILNEEEAKTYDSDDDEQIHQLSVSLRQRFDTPAAGRPVDTEVQHPSGYVIEQYKDRG